MQLLVPSLNILQAVGWCASVSLALIDCFDLAFKYVLDFIKEKKEAIFQFWSSCPFCQRYFFHFPFKYTTCSSTLETAYNWKII